MATPILSLRSTALGLLATAVSLSLLTGCASSFDPLEGTTPPATAVGTIGGTVHGGQGPIVGASVYVYQVNAATYGGASLQLANPVVTDANGKFLISSYTTTCTSGRPVYLYSVGGNAGGNGINSAAGLLAALGPCPSSGTLAAAYPQVNMNEVSTVAMAYAVAGFATDATHIGYGGSALGLTGITNAFATANNIFPVATAVYPTSTAPAHTVSTANGTLPTQLINTVADALAGCVNSAGPTSNGCTANSTTKGLFYYATTTGVAGGTAPTDTATAAIYIALHPYANAPGIWSLNGGSGSPFQTALSSAPNDLSLSIAYTATNYNAADLFPRELAVDAAGNVWAADGNNFVDKFTPLGVGTSYSSGPLTQPQAVAIDNAAAGGGTATVYVAGYANALVGRFNSSTGALINSYQTASSTLNGGPADLAIDKSGNIWSANYLESSIGKQTAAGTGAATTYTNGNMTNPVSIATDTSGNLFLSDYGDSNLIKFTSGGVGSLFNSACGGGGSDAVAIDGANSVWCADYQSLISVTSAGATHANVSFPSTGEYQNSVAIDGNGNVWTTAEDNDTTTGEIYEFDVNGSHINSNSGYIVAAVPDSIAIDGSGNVWYTDFNSYILHELVGAAAPVATPIAYGAVNSKLGAKP